MPRLTLKQVNAALRAAGFEEELVRGAGYFYFDGGEAHRWPSSSVMVYRLNELTLDQWLAEHKRLREG